MGNISFFPPRMFYFGMPTPFVHDLYHFVPKITDFEQSKGDFGYTREIPGNFFRYPKIPDTRVLKNSGNYRTLLSNQYVFSNDLEKVAF